MISFASDYLEGCLPEVLQGLIKTNAEQHPGYSEDNYVCLAREAIRAYIEHESAAIHFVVSGTMANAIVIRQILRPHQGVIAADSGHIAVHEAGAIEAGGHKVLTIPVVDGKLTAAHVEQAIQAHRQDATREHMVQPGMVYISQPTECGTLYSKKELRSLKDMCECYSMPLYIDGARLAYALAATDNDISVTEYKYLCDVLTFGGTKCGLMMGEAICLFTTSLAVDLRYVIKQMGGMLAKGRLLGVQFLTLFENDLYFKAAFHAISMADRLRHAFSSHHISFAYETSANQLFPILSDADVEELKKKFEFERWQSLHDNKSVVRFCTSWATTENAVAMLESSLNTLYDTQL